MKYVRGFLMAWGCFCWIPCPYKKWNDDDRTAMVAMLPLVGTGLALVTGIVWVLIGLLGGSVESGGLAESGGSAVLSGAVVTAAYFVMTGFIHLDGFMDVCDAVMPRHPVMEERIRILKDPHTGSFAAVSMALMLLVFAGSAAALSALPGFGVLVMIAVMTTSRCMSAVSVISCRPMGTSQYATGNFGEASKGRSFVKALPALIITALVVAGCVVFCVRSAHAHAFGENAVWQVPAAAAVCAVTALIIGAIDRRSLGGMNGDISGHMITSGEMAGMLAAAILMG